MRRDGLDVWDEMFGCLGLDVWDEMFGCLEWDIWMFGMLCSQLHTLSLG